MDEDEDEEEEDAEWSQLPQTGDAQSAADGDANDAELPIANRSAKFKRAWTAVGKDAWNADAWLALMAEAQQLPIAEARGWYDKFLAQFPTSVGSRQAGWCDVVPSLTAPSMIGPLVEAVR